MVQTDEELGAWLRLSLTQGVGNETMRRLLAAWGSAPAVFQQNESTLRQVVQPAQARALMATPEGWHALLEDTRQWLQVPGHALVSLGDADYPAALLDIPDPPLMLYAMGQTQQLPTLNPSTALPSGLQYALAPTLAPLMPSTLALPPVARYQSLRCLWYLDLRPATHKVRTGAPEGSVRYSAR